MEGGIGSRGDVFLCLFVLVEDVCLFTLTAVCHISHSLFELLHSQDSQKKENKIKENQISLASSLIVKTDQDGRDLYELTFRSTMQRKQHW